MSNPKKSDRNEKEKQVEDLIDDLLPTELTRRDTLALFTGFDKKTNQKLLGAAYQIIKGKNKVNQSLI